MDLLDMRVLYHAQVVNNLLKAREDVAPEY